MRILVSNDDGIEAPGLARLVEAAERISNDVWVVAPEDKHTAAAASITIGKPLTMHKRGERRYACSGRPADCIVTAMAWLFDKERKPDLVLSGINDGRNVGEDIAYSGTLGIAREASFWGLPSVGFSRVKNAAISSEDPDWLAALIATLWQRRAGWALEGHYLAVNLPHALPAEIRQPFIGRDKIARTAEAIETDGNRTVLVIPRGRAHTATPGDDNSLIDAGFVTINRLNWFGNTPLSQSFLDELEATPS
ncbi:5'/3'-nucleotidase SurE [Mesorhizobium sp. CAU 1741]|uniref:5'/3'-nucleotidase SurE n=1 Tax=Mesorhizobium sp. CAU 1741 TaxID=3140366 RepID=UPI00325B0947